MSLHIARDHLSAVYCPKCQQDGRTGRACCAWCGTPLARFSSGDEQKEDKDDPRRQVRAIPSDIVADSDDDIANSTVAPVAPQPEQEGVEDCGILDTSIGEPVTLAASGGCVGTFRQGEWCEVHQCWHDHCPKPSPSPQSNDIEGLIERDRQEVLMINFPDNPDRGEEFSYICPISGCSWVTYRYIDFGDGFGPFWLMVRYE